MEDAVVVLTPKQIIVAELKAVGIDLAEDVAVDAARALFSGLEKVVIATENKTDDLFLPLIAILKKPAFDALDKIDGKDDPAL